MKSTKPRQREMPSNRHEANFEIAASFEGWKFLRCGWPDYLTIKEGRIIPIEIKGDKDHLQHDQVIMFDVLAALGVEVFISLNGDPHELISVDNYIKSQNLIRTIENNTLCLLPMLKGVKGFVNEKCDVYFDHSWVYKYLGVKDARSTDHPK